MRDNKVRLSPDVLEKAEHIAAEWGLKNARAAIEAVFRTYCDVYRQGYPPSPPPPLSSQGSMPHPGLHRAPSTPLVPACEALDALDQLLTL